MPIRGFRPVPLPLFNTGGAPAASPFTPAPPDPPAKAPPRLQFDLAQNILPLLAALPFIGAAPPEMPGRVPPRIQAEIPANILPLLSALPFVQPPDQALPRTRQAARYDTPANTLPLSVVVTASPFFAAPPDLPPLATWRRQLDATGTLLPLLSAVPFPSPIFDDLPRKVARAQPDTVGTLLPMLSALPFVPIDQPAPVIRRAAVPAGDAQNNLALTTVTQAPFVPLDMARPVARAVAAQPDTPLNLLPLLNYVPGPVPFFVVDLGYGPQPAARVVKVDLLGVPLPLLDSSVVPPVVDQRFQGAGSIYRRGHDGDDIKRLKKAQRKMAKALERQLRALTGEAEEEAEEATIAGVPAPEAPPLIAEAKAAAVTLADLIKAPASAEPSISIEYVQDLLTRLEDFIERQDEDEFIMLSS